MDTRCGHESDLWRFPRPISRRLSMTLVTDTAPA